MSVPHGSGTWELYTTSHVGTKTLVNVYHYDLYGGAGRASDDLITDFTGGNLWAALLAALSVNLVFDSITARYLNDPDESAEYVVLSGVTGAITGDNLPTDVAGVCTLYTGKRGRNYRGSKHFGVIAESSTTGNQLADNPPDTGLTLWDQVRLYLKENIATTGGGVWVPVVLSRSLSLLETSPTSIVTNPITSVTLNRTLGTMRHRKERTVKN